MLTDFQNTFTARIRSYIVPSVLWRCWLGGRKGIRPVKNRVVGYWRGCLSGVRCRLAFGPADATATHCLSLSKIQIGFTFLVPAYPGCPGKEADKWLLSLPESVVNLQQYLNIPPHLNYVATLPCEISCSKNRHPQEVIEANDRVRLSHSKNSFKIFVR